MVKVVSVYVVKVSLGRWWGSLREKGERGEGWTGQGDEGSEVTLGELVEVWKEEGGGGEECEGREGVIWGEEEEIYCTKPV